MTSVVSSVLGAALLLTGASAAMAQSAPPPVANQPAQTDASAATAASTNAPVAYQSVQTSVSTAIPASTSAPAAAQTSKVNHLILCDNTDAYGGHGPNTLWGTRAFWEGQSDGQ